ncbi:MAG: flagellar hook-associated protein FlgK [Ignavibacteriales bacterium]
MRTPFMGIEIGKRALMAQQAALDVIGHNVANVNTPGYTRQEAILAATDPYASPGAVGHVGTGVQVTDIRRIRDAFIDMQKRTELKRLGEFDTMSAAFEEIEVILNEPSDSGIRSVLDKFWESLQELQGNPESEAVRKTVRESAVTLAESFNRTFRQLEEMQTDVDTSVRSKVVQINALAQQIAELNVEITRARSAGYRPNDLMDRRDGLLDDLAKIIDIRVSEEVSGATRVTVGGVLLVESQGAVEIGIREEGDGFAHLVWPNSGLDVNVSSGEIKGFLRLRDEYIEQIKTDINSLANSIISEINAQHALGFDYHGVAGGAFFKGTDAISMAIDDAILNDVSLIAASGNGLVGNGDNALALAQLKQKLTMSSDPLQPPNATWNDFFRGIVTGLGVDADHAKRMAENEDYLVNQMENLQQSVSGVSLDEEMTNMMKFQHAYQAAARLITAADEMLDVLINRTGLAGR